MRIGLVREDVAEDRDDTRLDTDSPDCVCRLSHLARCHVGAFARLCDRSHSLGYGSDAPGRRLHAPGHFPRDGGLLLDRGSDRRGDLIQRAY